MLNLRLQSGQLFSQVILGGALSSARVIGVVLLRIGWVLGLHGLQLPRNPFIAFSDLQLIDVIQGQILLERKQQLIAPVAFLTLGNLLSASMNARVPEVRQYLRVALTFPERSQDCQARLPADIADHVG